MHPEIFIDWPTGRHLIPRIALWAAIREGEFDEVELEADLERAYAWYDAWPDPFEAPEPDAEELLTPEQLRTVEAVSEAWPAMRDTLAGQVPKKLRPHLHWTRIHFGLRAEDGVVMVGVTGHCSASFSNAYAEHGLGALFKGTELQKLGVADDGRVPAASQPEPRPHPDFVEVTEAQVLEWVQRGDWLRLRIEVANASSAPDVGELLVKRALDAEEAEALELLEAAEGWPLRQAPLPAEWLEQGPAPAVIRRLIALGRYHVPGDVLFDEEDPERVRAWVALGAKLNQTTKVSTRGGAETLMLTPLGYHYHDLGLFELLLELGADPAALFDEDRRPLVPLGDLQRVLLRRFHPELMAAVEAGPEEAPAEEEAPGQDTLLGVWLQRGWIELAPDADRAAVNAALEALLERRMPVGKLVDQVFELNGVEELYCSDDELEGFLAVW
ncbi:MAG: hypothetical protein H6741_01710 [Alphaproteobacteria bacterium]|nr:hypothetical protein [Alphaproteobacteria bacterium]MCB9791418.1 hypothetical protein [Alphaproteobacteria bacterium]